MNDLNSSKEEVKPIGKLAEALAKAQSEFKVPQKNKKVDFTDKNGRRVHYSYADLADVIECVKDPLTKNNLSISHLMEFRFNHFGMTTTLMHSSGESISSWHPLPDPSKQMIKPQEFGSALTYARRYSLSSLIGVASEEDDDGGNAPLSKPAQPKQQNYQQQPKGKYTPNKQASAQQSQPAPKPQQRPAPPPPNNINEEIDPFDAAMMDTPLDDWENAADKHFAEEVPTKLVKNFAPKAIENDLAHCSSHPEDYIVNFGQKFKGKKLGSIDIIDLKNAANAVIQQGLDQKDNAAKEFLNFYDLLIAKRYGSNG